MTHLFVIAALHVVVAAPVDAVTPRGDAVASGTTVARARQVTQPANRQTTWRAATVKASHGTYGEALRRAEKTGEPLVVLVGAAWCPGCRVMKGKTLPEVAGAGGLKRVAYVYVDYDKDRALAKKVMKGKTIPQLVRYQKTSRGWQRHDLVGAQKAAKVLAFIQRGNAAKVATARRASFLDDVGLPFASGSK